MKKDSFNAELDHVRKLWGVHKGATLMICGGFYGFGTEPVLRIIGNDMPWNAIRHNDNEARS